MVDLNNVDYADVNKLEQQKTVNLLKIQLTDGRFIFICDSFDIDYLNDKYKFLEFTISGDKETQSGERTRPTLDISNPNMFLNKLALSGDLLGALVVRYQLEASYAKDVQLKLIKSNRWKLYQLTGVSTTVVFQLRTLADNAGRTIPPRQYYPPLFNHINV